MTEDNLASRFIIRSDPRVDRLIFDLPQTWWSRPYEYSWALSFCRPIDKVLDAGCGISHPLKYALADRAGKVYACDLDQRILSRELILEDMVNDFGAGAVDSFDRSYFGRVEHIKASMFDLPLGDKSIDRVLCISVIEHLADRFNRMPGLFSLPGLGAILPAGIQRSLKEFSRIVKDDGLVVMTLDHPTINLKYFRNAVARAGLCFAGPVDFAILGDALYSEQHKLRCFRAVLKKNK